jgi:4-hydroxy-3-polyprenylbenzoate decarboxylase
VPPQDHLALLARRAPSTPLPGRDEQFAKGPIDVLDHASRAWSYGSKLVIDGTVKHREEGGAGRGVGAPETVAGEAQGTAPNRRRHRAKPAPTWEPNPERTAEELPDHAEILDQHQVGGGFWFIATRKARADQGRHLGEWAARHPSARGVRLIAVVDHETDVRDFEEVLWTMLNNVDPERDVQVVANGAPDRRGVGGRRDAEARLEEGFVRPWPDKITMPDDVTASAWPQLAERVRVLGLSRVRRSCRRLRPTSTRSRS